KGLFQQYRKLTCVLDICTELCHRFKHPPVLYLLISGAVSKKRALPPGDGEHETTVQIRILQACREVCGAYGLRHANCRLSGSASISICHVGCGFLRVG